MTTKKTMTGATLIGTTILAAAAIGVLSKTTTYQTLEPDGSGLHGIEGPLAPDALELAKVRVRPKGLHATGSTRELADGRTLIAVPIGAVEMLPGETLEQARRRVWDGYMGKTYEQWWEQ